MIHRIVDVKYGTWTRVDKPSTRLKCFFKSKNFGPATAGPAGPVPTPMNCSMYWSAVQESTIPSCRSTAALCKATAHGHGACERHPKLIFCLRASKALPYFPEHSAHFRCAILGPKSQVRTMLRI